MTTPEHLRSTGAQPTGAATEAEAAERVQSMFDQIAPTYDRANHLLSVGLDRLWWRRAARQFRDVLRRPESNVVDLCCGTGDMTAALLRLRPHIPGAEPVLGLDFSAPMLDRARVKHRERNAVFIQADAMHLPLPDRSVDLIIAAFGFRNLSNYAAALTELFRVLRPGARFGILEANQPAGLLGAFYSLYFQRILPRIGGAISGEPSAYRYLPESVSRFPRPPRMLQMIREAGFSGASWTSYSLGAAGLYQGARPAAGLR